MKKNSIIKIIVAGIIAVVLFCAGYFTKLWDNLPETKIDISLANILHILFFIAVVIFIESLVVFILKKIKCENKRINTVMSITANLLKYIAAIVVFCGILSMLGVNIGTILAGLGIIALIIGFGAESLIADVVTGMFILLDNQYNVGDIIEINGFRGYVSDIGIRTTCVTDTGGNVKIINNSDMKNILNRSDNASKAVVDFPISYETDLTKLEEQIPELLEKIYKNRKDLFVSVPKYLGVSALSASSVDLKFIAEVKEQDIYSGTRALTRDLFVGMKEIGIECPFTQVDIHTK